MTNDKRTILLKARYPNSNIYRLRAERRRNRLQKIMKYLRFVYVDSQACILENLVDDNGWMFYLIEKESQYFLVAVSGETIKLEKIKAPLSIDEFQYGKWIFFNKGLIGEEGVGE